MRQHLLFRRLLSTLLLLAVTTLSWAYDFEVDGIYYSKNSDGTSVAVTYGFWPWYDSDDRSYSGNVIIPSSVTYDSTTYRVTGIHSYAFQDCFGLTSVTIPESVTTIDHYAFSGCSALTSVTIPESVTTIGYGAFEGCSALTSVTINSNDIVSSQEMYSRFGPQVQEYVIGDGVTAIGYRAFASCSALTSITIPESVTSIGSYAFSYCSNLTSVTIPESVTTIGYRAFYGCSALTSVTIPESVTTIGYDAFLLCTSLPVEDNLRYADTYLVEAVDGTQSTYNIKEGTKWIGSGAFSFLSNLTSITIPSSVTNIHYEAFMFCPNLTTVTVSEGNTVYDSRNGCNGIIETASNTLIMGFRNTVIPNSVTTIGEYAFFFREDLTSITIPEGVTEIGHNAFFGCSGLTSVTIPNSLTTIGPDAFEGCI